MLSLTPHEFIFTCPNRGLLALNFSASSISVECLNEELSMWHFGAVVNVPEEGLLFLIARDTEVLCVKCLASNLLVSMMQEGEEG